MSRAKRVRKVRAAKRRVRRFERKIAAVRVFLNMQERASVHVEINVSLWWLSYADDNGFRGVVITRAPGFLMACTRANLLSVSPGGQVRGFELPPEADDEIKLEDLDRCLNEEEAKVYA